MFKIQGDYSTNDKVPEILKGDFSFLIEFLNDLI